jgi:hypothetical protein
MHLCASARVLAKAATLPMFVRTRPSRTRCAIGDTRVPPARTRPADRVWMSPPRTSGGRLANGLKDAIESEYRQSVKYLHGLPRYRAATGRVAAGTCHGTKHGQLASDILAGQAHGDPSCVAEGDFRSEGVVLARPDVSISPLQRRTAAKGRATHHFHRQVHHLDRGRRDLVLGRRRSGSRRTSSSPPTRKH